MILNCWLERCDFASIAIVTEQSLSILMLCRFNKLFINYCCLGLWSDKSISEQTKSTVEDDKLKHASSRLQTNAGIFLKCVDPSGFLVTALIAQLYQRNLDSELDEQTREKLLSSTLTNYDKNFIMLQWLQKHSPSCLEAFLQAASSTEQQHVVNLLLGETGLNCLFHFATLNC